MYRLLFIGSVLFDSPIRIMSRPVLAPRINLCTTAASSHIYVQYSAVYSTAVYKPPYLSQLTSAVVAVALFPSTIKYIAFNMYIMFALLLQYTHFLVYVYKHFSMYFINNNQML
jgi:hypothetical protein